MPWRQLGLDDALEEGLTYFEVMDVKRLRKVRILSLLTCINHG